jgi:hypothetical protein
LFASTRHVGASLSFDSPDALHQSSFAPTKGYDRSSLVSITHGYDPSASLIPIDLSNETILPANRTAFVYFVYAFRPSDCSGHSIPADQIVNIQI